MVCEKCWGDEFPGCENCTPKGEMGKMEVSMETQEGKEIETVGELREWLAPLRDEQRIAIDGLDLLPDLDYSGCAQHQLATFIKRGGVDRKNALAEWSRRYGFDFPQYATGKFFFA